MAYIQRISPPTNKIIPFTIAQFNGGLNNRTTNVLAPNEAGDLLNMSFYDGMIMERRKGSKLYNTFTHPEAVTHLDEYKPYSGTNPLVIGGKSQVVFYTNGTGITVDLAGNGLDGENFMGRYVFADSDTLRVYGLWSGLTASTYVRIVGTKPTAMTDLTVVSTPAVYTPLDNTYKKGVTVYDFNQMMVWYEPCANEKADPYLGLSVVPTAPRYVASLKGRLYVSGSSSADDTVYMSQTGNPFYFPVSTGLQVPPNSDKIMGLVVYDDAVVVGRKRDIHIITGVTNDPELGTEMFAIKRLNTHTGFVSNKAVNVAHNYLFFLGFDGNAYALASARNDTKVLATTLISRQVDLKLKPFNFSQTDIESGVSYFFDGVWYLSIKGYVLLYDYRIQAWTVWNNLNIRSFYNMDSVLLWGNEQKQVCMQSTDYLDQGLPYISYWQSSSFDMGDPSTFKQFRDSYILAHTFTGYESDIRVGFELDYADINGSIVIPNEVAKWGVARFGDKYLAREINPSLPFTIGRRARTMKIRMTNGYTIKGTLTEYTDLALVKGMRQDDVYKVTIGGKYYVYNESTSSWDELSTTKFNQPMRVYQINGEYELRGKR